MTTTEISTLTSLTRPANDTDRPEPLDALDFLPEPEAAALYVRINHAIALAAILRSVEAADYIESMSDGYGSESWRISRHDH